MFDVHDSRPRVFLNKCVIAKSKNVVARPNFNFFSVFSRLLIITIYKNLQIFHFPRDLIYFSNLRKQIFRLRIRIIRCCFSIQLIVQRSNHSPCRTKVHHLASQVALPLHLLTIPHHSNQGVVLALEAEHLRVRW